MSRARFDKPCVASPKHAIDRAVRFLIQQGYELEEQAENQASLVFQRGSPVATQLDRTRHHLELTSDGNVLFLDFHSAMGSSGYLTKKERKNLEERAEAVAAAAGDAAPASENQVEDSFRCRYCSAFTPLGKPTCQRCGADNFV